MSSGQGRRMATPMDMLRYIAGVTWLALLGYCFAHCACLISKYSNILDVLFVCFVGCIGLISMCINALHLAECFSKAKQCTFDDELCS